MRFSDYKHIYFIILLAILSFILFSRAGAAAGCCIPAGGEVCQDASTGYCSQPDAYIVSTTLDCAQVVASGDNSCTKGCCCIDTQSGVYEAEEDVFPKDCKATDDLFKIFIPSVTDKTGCTAICRERPEYHEVTGFVKNITGALIAEAQIRAPGAEGKSLANGAYTISVLESTFTITANKSNCEGSINISGLEGNRDNANITMICCKTAVTSTECNAQNKKIEIRTKTCDDGRQPQVSEQTVDCEYTGPKCDWECTVSECDADGSKRNNTCVENSACTAGIHPTTVMPPKYIYDCSTPINSKCGNGILDDPAEKCDYYHNTTSNTTYYNSRCESPSNNSVALSCITATCQCNYVPRLGSCEQDPGNITSFGADPVAGQHAVKAKWTVNETCINYVDHFELSGCINVSGSCSFMTLNSSIPKSRFDYIDNGSIKENTQYCYELRAVYNSSVYLPAHIKIATACITTGDDECMQPHAPTWCGYKDGKDAIASCNASNNVQYQTTCPDGNFCAIITVGAQLGPQCIAQAPCAECNNVLAAFGSAFDTSFRSYFSCPTSQNRVSLQSGCYLDYTKSALDKAYACIQTTSCYDYLSRSACTEDYCKKFTLNGQSQCMWVDYSKDFNKGVCIPKDSAKQECSKCDDPRYNRLYPQCTKETCKLYGSCYYTGERCINASGISCTSYNNENDCIGGTNVAVDVAWDPAFSLKIAGTNALLAQSNDSAKIGRCRWTQAGCIKDADNNIRDDCAGIADVNTALLCEHDVKPPVTKMAPKSAYSLMMNLSNIEVYDDGPWPLSDYNPQESQRTGTWLYYCIASKGYPCYPSKVLPVRYDFPNRYLANLSEFSAYGSTAPIGESNNGQMFTFFYFAQDAAMNLEKVSSFDFMLDTQKPAIEVRHAYNSMLDSTLWKTNITFTLTLKSEQNPPVECTLRLRPTPSTYVDVTGIEAYDIAPENSRVAHTLNTPGQSISTTYPYLLNGKYNYTASCTDIAGNTFSESGIIPIDGDLRINSAYPTELVVTSAGAYGMNMSINTSSSGVCKYSESTDNFASMSGTFDNHTTADPNIFYHTAKLYISKGSPSRIYRFYVACKLLINGATMIVTGDNADIIYYAIDDIAPNTYVTASPDGNSPPIDYQYDSAETHTTMSMGLRCEDYADELNDSYWHRLMSFGCAEGSTQYAVLSMSKYAECVGSAYGLAKCPGVTYKEYKKPEFFDYSNDTGNVDRQRYGNSPYVCYYSADKGGNVHEPQCTHLNLRNGHFQEPNITITEGQ